MVCSAMTGVVHAELTGVGRACAAMAGSQAVGGEACHVTVYKRVCFSLDQ